MTYLQIAIDDLCAIRIAPGIYAYMASDEGSRCWYAVDSGDMRAYGRDVASSGRQGYSAWCADSMTTRLGPCDDVHPVPTLRRRWYASGDLRARTTAA